MSAKADQNPEPESTGHEWDGIKEYNNPSSEMVAMDILCVARLGVGLYDRLSCLALAKIGDAGASRFFDPGSA